MVLGSSTESIFAAAVLSWWVLEKVTISTGTKTHSLSRLPYTEFFGGVSGLTVEQFRKINGFPNAFWGWGGEDDDLWNRYHPCHVIQKCCPCSRPGCSGQMMKPGVESKCPSGHILEVTKGWN
jgi:hypothetical protein